MSSVIAQIADNLEQQIRVYSRVRDLMTRQQQALRARDVHAVHDVLQELEVALLERGRVDAARERLIELAAEELGIDVEDVSAAAIADASPADTGAHVMNLSRQLRTMISELDSLGRMNRILLQHELDVVDVLVKGIARTAEPRSYDRTGEDGGERYRKLVDMQV